MIDPDDLIELEFQTTRGVACWQNHRISRDDRPDDAGRTKITIHCGETRLGCYVAMPEETSLEIEAWTRVTMAEHGQQAAIVWIRRLLADRSIPRMPC